MLARFVVGFLCLAILCLAAILVSLVVKFIRNILNK